MVNNDHAEGRMEISDIQVSDYVSVRIQHVLTEQDALKYHLPTQQITG